MSQQFPDDPEYGAAEGGGAEALAFLLDPRGVVERRWPWMVAALLLGLVGTAAAVFTVQPRYAAEASVLISSQEIPQDFVRSTVQESSMANLNATVSQVLSNDNLENIIEQFDLYEDLRDSQTLDALVGRLRSEIEITPEHTAVPGSRTQTSVVYTLGNTNETATGAANVANALAALVVEASMVQRNRQAQRVTRFLQTALADDERELREQSRQVSEFRRANRGRLPEELDTNMRKLELLHQRRHDLISQIAEAEARILEIGSRRAPAERSDNELLLEQLRVQLARDSALNTEEHPNVKSLRRRVRALEAVVAAEGAGSGTGQVSALVTAERREIARMRDQIRQTDEDVTDLSARIDQTPGVSEELSALEQKETVLREDYLASLRKVEQAELAETLEMAQQGAQASVLNRARPPSAPTQPRWLLVVIGVGGSLALALGMAVLVELLDPVVVSVSQLEGITAQPVLGSLPWVR